MVNIQPQTAYNSYQKLQQAIKALPKSPSANEYKKIKELAEITKKLAQNEVEQKINNSSINKNVDKFLTIIFEKFASFFNKVGGHNSEDYGKTIVKGVLFGNILKDLMTGIVSTSQSFTNPISTLFK